MLDWVEGWAVAGAWVRAERRVGVERISARSCFLLWGEGVLLAFLEGGCEVLRAWERERGAQVRGMSGTSVRFVLEQTWEPLVAWVWYVLRP